MKMLKDKVIHQEGQFRLREDKGVLFLEMKPADSHKWVYFWCLHNFVSNYINELLDKINRLESEIDDLENDAWGDAFDNDGLID